MKYQKIDPKQAFIGLYPDAFPKESCKLVIDEFEKALLRKDEPEFKDEIYRGETGYNYNKKLRSDISLKVNKLFPELNTLINNHLFEAVKKYYDEYFVLEEIALSSNQTKIQKTEPRGGFHVWHFENSLPDVADRVLVWTIYLNDVANGEGETEFIWQGLRIKPKAGTICIFPASFTHTHRGNPVYTQDKYIATGWFTHVKNT